MTLPCTVTETLKHGSHRCLSECRNRSGGDSVAGFFLIAIISLSPLLPPGISVPVFMTEVAQVGRVVLGIAPASPTSWDLGPRLHIYIRFGVGGTLNSKKKEKRKKGRTLH